MRGNKRIIDELEGIFRGAGWNVIKVVWGADWDDLFARDHTGLLLQRMEECVDGEYQTFKAKDGAYLRKEFFGKYPELLELVEDMTRRAAGASAPRRPRSSRRSTTLQARDGAKGGPTVILAKTVKGYGLGSSQARNATHNEKKLTDSELAAFVKRFDIPIPEEAATHGTPYRPAQDCSGDQYTAGAAARAGRHICRSARCRSRVQGAGARILCRVDRAARTSARSRRRWALSASCGIC